MICIALSSYQQLLTDFSEHEQANSKKQQYYRVFLCYPQIQHKASLKPYLNPHVSHQLEMRKIIENHAEHNR